MKMNVRRILSVVMLIALSHQGCSENMDPNTPDGALRIFAKDFALQQGDLLYEKLTENTKNNLAELLSIYQKQQKLAMTYPASHQKWAQKETSIELAQAKDAKALFNLLIKNKLVWLKDQKAEEIEQGLNGRKVIQSQKDKAIVITRSQDQIELKFEKEIWRIAIFENSIQDLIKHNQNNMENMKKNLDEIQRRQSLNLQLPPVN
jgi:hypothetical protein